jgi:hypothetical protein
MKKIISLFILMALLSCHSEDAYKKPSDATDCFRSFVEATMKGKFELASEYMLKDSTNDYLLTVVKKTYEGYSKAKKDSMRMLSGDFNIHEIANVNDTVTVINFSNKVMPDQQFPIRVIKIKDNYFVDLKYTQSGNM